LYNPELAFKNLWTPSRQTFISYVVPEYLDKNVPEGIDAVKTNEDLQHVLPIINAKVDLFLRSQFTSYNPNNLEDKDELQRAVGDWVIGKAFSIPLDSV